MLASPKDDDHARVIVIFVEVLVSVAKELEALNACNIASALKERVEYKAIRSLKVLYDAVKEGERHLCLTW